MNDILYCPLDLPPVPKELTVESAELLYDYVPNFNEKQVEYLRSKKQVNAYAWRLIKLRTELNTNPAEPCSGPKADRWQGHDNQWDWTATARSHFPLLIEYIEKYLPYDYLKYVVILNSVGQVDPHFDIPPSVNEALKEQYIKSEPSQYRLLIDGSMNDTFYVQNRKIGKMHTILPQESPGWVMGTYSCQHGNIEKAGDKKLLCVITGQLNLEKHKKILEKSYQRYSDYAIVDIN